MVRRLVVRHRLVRRGSARPAGWRSHRGSAPGRPAAAAASRSTCRRFRRGVAWVAPGRLRAGSRSAPSPAAARPMPATIASATSQASGDRASGTNACTAASRRRLQHHAKSPGATPDPGRPRPVTIVEYALRKCVNDATASARIRRRAPFRACGRAAPKPPSRPEQRQLGKGGGERRLGDDLRLDAGRKPLGPGFVVALHRCQSFFFAYQRFDVAEAVFHGHIPPFSSANPNRSDQLDTSL